MPKKKETNLPDGVQAVKDKPDTYRFFVSCGFDEDGTRLVATETRKGLKGIREIAKAYDAFKVDARNPKGVYWTKRNAKKAVKEKPQEVKKTTVSDILDMWFELYKVTPIKNGQRPSPKTIYDISQWITKRIKPVFIDTEADKLSSADVQLFFDNLVKEGAGKGHKNLSTTSKKIIGILNNAFKYAVKRNLVPANPISGIEAMKADRKEGRFYSPEQVNQMLKALEKEDIETRSLITTAYYSGLRRGELTALTWNDLTVDKKGRGWLNVDKSLLCLPGTGYEIKTTKTKNSVRVVPIPSHVVKLLEKHRAAQREARIRLGSKWKNRGTIFTGTDGEYLHPDVCGRMFREFQSRHKLEKLNFHGLRHSFCTTRLYAGEPIIKVAGLMGHANAKMVAQVYGHICKDIDEDAADTIDLLLKSRSTAPQGPPV
jgi:integrase